MPKSYHFSNLIVTCPNCFPPIEEELINHQKRLKITNWHLDDINKIATVYVDDDNELNDEDIDKELRFVLKDWLPIIPPSPKNHYHGWQAALGLTTGIAMMVLMMLGIPLPSWLHDTLIYGGSLLTLWLGWPSYRTAFSALISKRKFFSMDTLFSISTLAAITITLLHMFIPMMPMLIDAALMIFGFRHFGLWLEEKVTQKSFKQERFVDRGRKTSIKRKNTQGEFLDCKLNDIGLANIIKISAGECIPLNGWLMQEKADITFALHTGKMDPETIQLNGTLYAGMIAQEDILMKVSALEDESYLRKRDLDLINAQMQKAPIQNRMQTILNWFIPSVLAGASLILGAGYWLGMSIAIKASLYLLVCACPCALGLVIPLAINIGLTKTKDQGLVFNTAKGLQAAADINMAVFDLNGTLTYNKPQVVGIPTVPNDYFDIVYAMEAQSEHPIAKGIRHHIGQSSTSDIAFDVFERFDNGMIARLNGNIYKMGNAQFINPPFEFIPTNIGNAQHIIYFMKNGKIEGYFLLEDPLREDAALMIKNLQKNNIKIRLLTATDRHTADQFAEQLNIPENWIKTDCTPQSKNMHIQYFKSQGDKVAMFGDAGNDINAIASADLGVAVTSPATDPMSQQHADATLNNHSLLPILQLFAVGRQTMGMIKQNLWVSFGYNIISLGFVACAMFLFPTVLNPAYGAALMAFQSACILCNAYRIKHQEAFLPISVHRKDSNEKLSPIQQPAYEIGSNLFLPSSSPVKSLTKPSEQIDMISQTSILKITSPA